MQNQERTARSPSLFIHPLLLRNALHYRKRGALRRRSQERRAAIEGETLASANGEPASAEGSRSAVATESESGRSEEKTFAGLLGACIRTRPYT